jgi:hypothetical protein
MRWHKGDSKDSNIMSHPIDGEAWQALDHYDPEYTRDPKSVHLGLSTYGFEVYSIDSSSYSC